MIAAVEGHQQRGCPLRMGGPVDEQEDQGPFIWLGDDCPHMKLWPVERRDGIGRGDFARQRQRVQIADMDQVCGPGQPGGDKQDHGRWGLPRSSTDPWPPFPRRRREMADPASRSPDRRMAAAGFSPGRGTGLSLQTVMTAAAVSLGWP